jgi:hypothetical protein
MSNGARRYFLKWVPIWMACLLVGTAIGDAMQGMWWWVLVDLLLAIINLRIDAVSGFIVRLIIRSKWWSRRGGAQWRVTI